MLVSTTPSAAQMIPNEVRFSDLTPAEQRANAVWTLRGALNVAALQCQYSPFLRAVANYNDLLRHHGDEMASAMKTMQAYYTRTLKKGTPRSAAQKSFDNYTTRTYQSFSSIDAVLPFCEAAALAGRRALATPKRDLGPVAIEAMPAIRASLTPQPESQLLREVDRSWVLEPMQYDFCVNERGKRIRRCGEIRKR